MQKMFGCSAQRPVGWLAVVVLAMLVICTANWSNLVPASRAADRSEAESLLLSGVYNDDPAVIRQAEKAGAFGLGDRITSLALVTAVTEGHARAVEELIRHGVPVDAPTRCGRTPLLLAAGTDGDLAIVKLLLDAGADPRAVSDLGETPVGEAGKIGDQRMIDLLRCASGDGRQVSR